MTATTALPRREGTDLVAHDTDALRHVPVTGAATRMRIDFVSDVSCPWCAIGLRALEEALARIGPSLAVALHFQPFELNPQLGPAGQDIAEYMAQKYGLDADEVARNGEAIRARGAALGFDFRLERRSRTYNTFDAHRLLHWAGLEAPALQHALKRALFKAYFTDGENPGGHAVLLRAATAVGLDAARAAQVLATTAYADEVRERERFYQAQGIRAVPSVIIDEHHLIQGGQPVAIFEQALRQIAAAA